MMKKIHDSENNMKVLSETITKQNQEIEKLIELNSKLTF